MSTHFVFDDGSAYEHFMGVWSRLVGEPFLRWIAPSPGLRWADIGCGNGCSTEQLCQLVHPGAVDALDPSPEQLAHAGALLKGLPVTLHQGSAMQLPFEAGLFDAAVMALVIFFVPDPAQGLAEMRRVTRPGGTVAAYVWDIPAGGLPWEHVWDGQRALGLPVVKPPSAAVSDLAALEALWRQGGLDHVEAQRITVERQFPDFETYWQIWAKGSPQRASVPQEILPRLREETRKAIGCAEGTPFTVPGVASAVKGIVPA